MVSQYFICLCWHRFASWPSAVTVNSSNSRASLDVSKIYSCIRWCKLILETFIISKRRVTIIWMLMCAECLLPWKIGLPIWSCFGNVTVFWNICLLFINVSERRQIISGSVYFKVAYEHRFPSRFVLWMYCIHIY